MKPSSKSVLHSRGTRQQRGSASSRSHKTLAKLTAVTKEPGVDVNLDNTARDNTAHGPEFKNDLQEDSAAESGKVFLTKRYYPSLTTFVNKNCDLKAT